MSLLNESQVLLRNIDHLGGEKPLLVNFPSDGFVSEYAKHFPSAIITCYNTNFEYHLGLKSQNANLKATQVNYQFCTHYQSDNLHDVVIIHFPKSKAELGFTLAMLHSCVAENGQVFVVGHNKSGIKSLEKLTKNNFASCDKIDSARHCSVFACEYAPQENTFELDTWFKDYQFTISGQQITISSLPGVFSQQHLDKGTALLLKHLPKKMSGSVLDFGCGAGVISCVVGKLFPEVSLSLLDVSALALTSAQRTLEKNQLIGQLIASNSLSELKGRFQHIVSNPPFHQGVKTNYVATESFLKQIKQHIKPQGDITVVANSFLQYQPIMQQSIGHTDKLCSESGFSIYRCQNN